MPKQTNKCAICGKPIIKSKTLCAMCERKNEAAEQEIAESRVRLIPELLWEKRRYEIAKDMLAAFLSNSSSNVYRGTFESQARDAVGYADALIAELRKEGKK